MRPFSDEQVERVQALLDRNFSLHGQLKVEEDEMRDITTQVLGITGYQTKKNFMFWDCRATDFGLEFKKRKYDQPTKQIGKAIEFTMSRTIDNVPTESPEAALVYLAEQYNLSVDEFSTHCGNNSWFAGALHSDDTLVYYHEAIEHIRPEDLEAVWDYSNGRSKRTFNLYARDRKTGEMVLKYLSNGQKLQMYLRVPEEVHVFKARKTHQSELIDLDAHTAFMRKFAQDGESIEDVVARLGRD